MPIANESHAATLVELVRRHAHERGDRIAYHYLDEPRSFAQLWSAIADFAAALIEQGLGPGDRVVLTLANGHDFFTAFYGSIAAGGVAVPIFPGSSPERVIDIAALCGADHVVVSSDIPVDTLAGLRKLAEPLTVLTTHESVDGSDTLPPLDPDDVAFIQYTSGTTGDSKGVQLTHANLLTNVHQMIAGWGLTEQDRFVSWVPCYHDMGLIAMTMIPFALAAPLFLLPTAVRDTRPWLDAVERHRGTFTASPDFGYRLCLRQLANSDDGAVPDLSSLRIALNAAEQVRGSTIEEFHETFGLENVMIAAYGLAEATVGVSSCKPRTPCRVDDRGTVSVGSPFPDIEVQILDDDDQPLPPDEAGHIVVVGPATTQGYFRNPTATEALFVETALGTAIRTGDIGYVDHDGNLYMLSRAKDVIIQAGRTVYPEEIEEIASALDGVRYSVAIGVDHGRVEGEQVTVLAEIRPDELSDDAARKACVIAITRGVHERFGFHPARVHLVAPKTIVLTHNGKLRRGELRQRYVDGELADSILYPPVNSR